VTTLRDVIFDAYAQALLAAKQKGLTGEDARAAACRAAAHVVTRATGKAVSTETVAKAVGGL